MSDHKPTQPAHQPDDRPSLPAELLQLCGKVRDDSLTEQDARRLDTILQSSAQALEFYTLYMTTASLLEARPFEADEASNENDSADLLFDLLKFEQQAHAETIHIDTARKAKPSMPATRSHAIRDTVSILTDVGFIRYVAGRALTSKPALVAYAAAIALLAAVLLIPWGNAPQQTAQTPPPSPRLGEATPRGSDPTDQPGPLGPPQTNPVATLTAEHNAVWDIPGAEGALARGSKLRPGTRLTLTAGFAEITTNRGAVAIIEAPATIELLNNNALQLHIGKLVGICETESSKGFLVRTPHMDITDLGTRFGVDATAPEFTEAHVWLGEVEVALVSDDRRATGTQRLVGGDAISASAPEGLVAIDLSPQRFAALHDFETAHVGIAAMSGDILWSPTSAYVGIDRRAWQSSDQVVVFEELSRYRLSADAPVTLAGPGSTSEPAQLPREQTIPSGTLVRTYILLLNSNMKGRHARTQGSVTFEGDVLGIASGNEQAIVFNAMVGDPTRIAPIDLSHYSWADLEWSQTDRDRVALQDDKRTVDFAFYAGSGVTDAVRVFVRVPEE